MISLYNEKRSTRKHSSLKWLLIAKMYPSASKVRTTNAGRILLIGLTGHGKSSTGNTILGFERFVSGRSGNSITKKCEHDYAERFGKTIVVVDTPGLCDTDLSEDEIHYELIRACGYSYPGFHAIIYVMKPERFTKECLQTKDLFFKWFGTGVEKHAMVILTHWKENDGNPSQFFNDNRELTTFLASCGNRVVAINNNGSETEKQLQVKKLLTVIDGIVEENRGSCFTSEMIESFNESFDETWNQTVATSNVKEARARFDSDTFVTSFLKAASAIGGFLLALFLLFKK